MDKNTGEVCSTAFDFGPSISPMILKDWEDLMS